MSLPTDKIKIAWFNPRECRDPEIIQALTESAKKSGILEPIHVAKIGDEYLCIDGGARLLVARSLGLKEVPVKIYETSLENAMKLTGEIQLTKDDLTPAEKGKFVMMLVKRGIFKNADNVAEHYNISRTTIYEWIRQYKSQMVLDEVTLPKPVAKELVSLPREIRKTVAHEVAQNIINPELQKQAVKEIKREIREKLIEKPEEAREVAQKTIQKITQPTQELDVKGREFNYHVFMKDRSIVIMKMERQTLQEQISIPLRDLDILLRYLQKFVE
jgi:ParB/RepB/Spo0J family partition protein